MGWMTRFTTLLRADAHGVIDALEDRALLLRQHLREARQAVEAKRAGLAGLEAEIREAETKGQVQTERIANLERSIELALAEEREDLARFAIKKLLPVRETQARGERRHRALVEERERMAEALAEQEEALVDLEARVRAKLAGLGVEGGADGEGAVLVTEDDVELELLRRRSAAPQGAAS